MRSTANAISVKPRRQPHLLSLHVNSLSNAPTSFEKRTGMSDTRRYKLERNVNGRRTRERLDAGRPSGVCQDAWTLACLGSTPHVLNHERGAANAAVTATTQLRLNVSAPRGGNKLEGGTRGAETPFLRQVRTIKAGANDVLRELRTMERKKACVARVYV